LAQGERDPGHGADLSACDAPFQRELIAEANANRARGGDHLPIGLHTLGAVNSMRYGNAENLIVLITDHFAKAPFRDEIDRVDAKAGAENAIESRRGTPALEMAQHAAACLLLGAGSDLRGDLLAHSAELVLARSGFSIKFSPVFGVCTFGYDDHGTGASFGRTLPDRLCHGFVAE